MKFNFDYIKKIIKKNKTLYMFIKIIRAFIEYLHHGLAFSIAVILHKFINKYFLKYTEKKFLSIINYPKNIIDFILCYSMVQKYKKLDLNELKKINYQKWAGNSGSTWHDTDKKYEKMDELFERQADELPYELSRILKLKKDINFCIVDIAVGNGYFLKYFTNKVNIKTKKIGVDINKKTIKENVKSKLFSEIKFLDGTVQSNKNYLEKLSQDYHLIFFVRKSLTFFTEDELIDLLNNIETFKNLHLFVLIEMNDLNMTVEKKSRIRDYHPLFFSHNYLKIFNKFNWKLNYEKTIYYNYFKNDYQINVIFKK